jgi:hypothetical protein
MEVALGGVGGGLPQPGRRALSLARIVTALLRCSRSAARRPAQLLRALDEPSRPCLPCFASLGAGVAIGESQHKLQRRARSGPMLSDEVGTVGAQQKPQHHGDENHVV